MESVSLLAAHLDVQMLLRRGVAIADEATENDALPACDDPLIHLGGRYLIKYLRAHEEKRYSIMSATTYFDGIHYFTPAPLAGCDLHVALNLPPADDPQRALLVYPEELRELRGPRRIAGGIGIEYVALKGFPLHAIVPPRWPREHL